MVGVFAAPVNALTATAPTWEVGDTWAMGKEVDLGSDLTDNITYLNQALKAAANLTIDDLNVDSTVGMYVVFTVASETTTTYTLTAKVAMKFATQASVSVTGKLPAAGTYDAEQNPWMSFSTVPKETKTVSLDLTEKLGFVLSATAIVNKTDYALRQMDWNLRSAFLLDVTAKNIPNINSTDDQQVISYKDYDIGMDLVAKANMSMMFSPALDVYQFPFTEYDEWTTNNSMVTVNGDVSGFFNARGLTAEQEAQIFTEELMNATGSSSFPIEFDHLTSPDGEITDGQLGPYSGNVTSMDMYCVDAVTKIINGANYDVFTIQVDDGMEMIYSPGFKLLGMPMDAEDLPVDLPDEVSTITSLIGQQDMEMEPVSVSTATSNIASIESYTDAVASHVSGDKGSNGLGDFFFKSPFLGIIMVVIAAIVIDAMVLIGMKARKH
jgi:hypothetical protein